MALANILQPNSYSVIDQLSYSKQRKEISFYLCVFFDSSKVQRLTDMYFNLNGVIDVVHVIDADITELPAQVSIGDTYIVAKNATGDLEQYAGQTIVWTGSNYVSYSSDNTVIWLESKGCYVKAQDGYPKVQFLGKKEYEQFFSSEVVNSIGIVAACYQFVKSMEFAQGAVDC